MNGDGRLNMAEGSSNVNLLITFLFINLVCSLVVGAVDSIILSPSKTTMNNMDVLNDSNVEFDQSDFFGVKIMQPSGLDFAIGFITSFFSVPFYYLIFGTLGWLVVTYFAALKVIMIILIYRIVNPFGS